MYHSESLGLNFTSPMNHELCGRNCAGQFTDFTCHLILKILLYCFTIMKLRFREIR